MDKNINPEVIPQNSNETLVSFEGLFQGMAINDLVQATLHDDALGKTLGKSSPTSLDILKSFAVRTILNPCTPKTRLTIIVEYIRANGGEAKATKGPYAYTPDKEEYENMKS